jgi:HAD superfamily hydrolase (TIGR01509 family)
VAAYRAHHPSVLRSGTTLLPSAREALAAFHARGIKLGICSNKPVDYTRQLVEYLDIAGLLDIVLGPEDVGRRLKPAPDILRLALQRLAVPPTQALYIGDMVVDIETARAAGVPVWVVATGSDPVETLDRSRPDRRLGSLSELAALVS